ncbi:transcriptional regulator [Companilactobacillus tucceti DSM 20183]|uniref:Transcriptional regulator n=1 Tax=Companilactobacillus tucceti DSM 20183 TaxID=1423811 RepID=A0A0R1J7C9_9LACO|nr:TetR/AcrR family transcriptional regulator C-terminal domain-containing protein [Companilactobacillus tucceti]KRK64739.1 transcriptional regulator [Companilactobacillus tucceti DSM 20183]
MQRNTKTEDKIKKAFIQLMKAGFDNLTVRDITDVAKINRSTFYAHYTDKYELLNHYETSVLKSLSETLNNNLNSLMKYQDVKEDIEAYPVIDLIMGYIESESDLIRVLIVIPSFESKIKNILRQVIDKGLYLNKGNDKTVGLIPNDYAYEIIISGLLNTVEYWLSKDKPETKDEIVDIIMKTRYLSPYDLLGVDRQFGNTIRV